MNWRCQDSALVGVSGRRARVTALRCRRWSCEWCAKRLRAKMVARAHAGFIRGQRVRMFTLTAPGTDTVEQSYEELTRRWKRFREALRRRFPGARFEYFRVTERQGRGHAHLHVLSRGPYIPQPWLSRAAAQARFGPVADIREVGPRAASYVAKYLGKEMGPRPERRGFAPLPRWHRRASWSRSWAPGFQESWLRWMAHRALDAFSWYVVNSRPLLAAFRLQALGYELDEIDYGDRPPADQGWELGRKERVTWLPAGSQHRRCWLCQTKHPAARRPHAPDWLAIPPARAPAVQLWPDL